MLLVLFFHILMLGFDCCIYTHTYIFTLLVRSADGSGCFCVENWCVVDFIGL